MDTSKLHSLGWNNCRSLSDGVSQTYDEWITAQKQVPLNNIKFD